MGVTRLGYRGVIGRLFQRVTEVNADDWAPQVAMLIQTDQASEEYRWLGHAPAVREWIGGRQPAALRESGITIANKTYEASIELNIDELRRDKSGQMLLRVDDLAARVRSHWHKLLSDLIVTPGNAYDGTTFYSATHSEADSGTQLNLLTATQVPALDVTVAAPTVAEIQAAIIGVVQYMMAYKDDKGEPLNWNAKSFMFMVPTWLAATFAQATAMPLINSGGAALPNLLTQWPGMSFRVVVNPRFTAGSLIFYTFIIDQAVKPFIMQEELLTVGEDDQEFMNNRKIIGVKLIRNVGTAFWQYASKATLS